MKRLRDELVFHFPHYQGDSPHTALFLGKHKLLRFYENESLHLFDMSKDILESNNLAKENPELANLLLKKWNFN